jgi:hypothetical protein
MDFHPLRSAALLALSMACMRTHHPSPSDVAADQAHARRNTSVITLEELQDPTVVSNDALTTIRLLRPQYFMTRGPVSFKNANAGKVQISQDFGPLQQLTALSGIDTRSLKEVRYLNSTEATARFGINANGGPVIVLLTTSQ